MCRASPHWNDPTCAGKADRPQAPRRRSPRAAPLTTARHAGEQRRRVGMRRCFDHLAGRPPLDATVRPGVEHEPHNGASDHGLAGAALADEGGDPAPARERHLLEILSRARSPRS